MSVSWGNDERREDIKDILENVLTKQKSFTVLECFGLLVANTKHNSEKKVEMSLRNKIGAVQK